MADALVVQHSVSGATVYALIRNSAGAVWNGAAFESYLTANLGTYDVAMTEQGTASRLYAATVPGLAVGLYSVVAFVRAGGSPAETDTAIGAGEIDWTGTAFTTVASRSTQTSVDDLPTNAELATALAAADDAVLAAIAALNNLSQANIRTAVGLATANLDTQLDALPTNAELATALAAADDAVLAALASLNNLSQANIRTAVGLASANLDTQLDALPTNAELATALATADDAVLAAIAALNNLSAAQVNAEADTALVDAALATAANLATAQAAITLIKAKTDTLPDGITKNQALANFTFFMASSVNHVTGATGLTVTATRSLDGATFAACANAVSEIGGGWYKITLAAGDLNGDIVALLFSATGADARALTLKTEV